MSEQFMVHIVRMSDGETVKEMGPMSESKAEKVHDGVLINLNTTEYFVAIKSVECLDEPGDQTDLSPTFDRHGYPTEVTLRIIREWKQPITKESARDFFTYCCDCWHENGEFLIEDADDTIEFHTGGWSGNEDIISAIQANVLIWSMCWQESRRGGHHVFSVADLPGAIDHELTTERGDE